MTITINVDVDVDLEQFDDDDLCEEFERRGLESNLTGGHWGMINEIFYAFKLGREDHAIELSKQLAQDVTGKILC